VIEALKPLPWHPFDFVGTKKAGEFNVQVAHYLNRSGADDGDQNLVASYSELEQQDAWRAFEVPCLPRAEATAPYLAKLFGYVQATIEKEIKAKYPLDENFRFTQDYELPAARMRHGINRVVKKGDLYEQNSTATMVTVSPEGIITTAHVGDSPAALIIKNSRTGEYKIHNLCVMNPKYDLASMFKNREVDPHSRHLGISDNHKIKKAHEPIIAQFDIRDFKENEDDECSVCVMTDGTIENLFTKKINNTQSALNKLADGSNLSDFLCKRAKELCPEQSDNMTVLVTKIPKLLQGMGLCVADGETAYSREISTRATQLFRDYSQSPLHEVARMAGRGNYR